MTETIDLPASTITRLEEMRQRLTRLHQERSAYLQGVLDALDVDPEQQYKVDLETGSLVTVQPGESTVSER